ncbi:MAG TPA: pitrilysin family protein [Thermoanaerobaculia bacterium]|nr:pitrilysin family protein [Thermoanaerobaculia bacterium]
MSKARILLFLLCALVPVALLAQRPDDILPFKAVEKTLPNGLKVIVVPTGFPNVVALYIPVRTGSRNEIEPGKSGFAHFFEHMMFRGTPSYPPDKYNAVVQKAGARQNAYTTDDRTVYHTTFAKEDLPKILEIEADRFQNLSYTEEVFKTEARAVLGEYNKNAANPIQKLFEVQRDSAFTTHTYKHTTMGFLRDIEDMPNQFGYAKEFFRRWYRPEYTTVIVAGDVKAEEVLPLVEKFWGNWKSGTYRSEIPQEPPSKGPVYAHVAWPAKTLPWVSVAFRVPGFDENSKEIPALQIAYDLQFGQTSNIYKRLVQDEQKVDQLFPSTGARIDPTLFTVFARLKNPADAVYVRDAILAEFAKLRENAPSAERVDEAKANTRYSFVRSLDNTDAIASTLAVFVGYRGSYDTINNAFRQLAAVTPEDIQAAAGKYLTDNNVVVTTLSSDPLPDAIRTTPSLASFAAAAPVETAGLRVIEQKSVLPQIQFKLLFNSGSVNDPKGKEGLAALTAQMITEAGSVSMRIDEISKALFPMAGSFFARTDKEMTTFTGSIHRDNWKKFFDIVLPQLLEPGFREEDFRRLRDRQLNALRQDLRANNEEELGKEELINTIYAGTPLGHTVLGTVAGIEAISLDDVKKFAAEHYTRGNLVIGVSGDYPDELLARLRREVAKLPAGTVIAQGKKSLTPIAGDAASGLEVKIIKKDTRSTAISIGMPIPVTREHPDFAALNVARAWLGEHRSSTSHLYQRIREERGLNYGDYAYIEFFTRPGFQFFPSPNTVRRAQAFEIWIRPVVPENAQMALRIALYELDKLIRNGLTKEQFESTRDYLMKNVYLMTATQDQQLGYALDSWWFGMPEYTKAMRERYAKLTRADVNKAIRKYLSSKNLHVVIVAKDAEGLRDALVKDGVSSIRYDAPKPKEIVEEDRIIGAYRLNIKPENVTIVPVEDVFAK